MSHPRLDQLKGKYQSGLNPMSQLGVQLENLHLQEDGDSWTAKSKADSNQLWDQIKLVDQNYQQISWPR